MARWGVVEGIERPLLMIEVQGSDPGHSIQKIPFLYLKPSGSSELGMWRLSFIGGDTGFRTAPPSKKETGVIPSDQNLGHFLS